MLCACNPLSMKTSEGYESVFPHAPRLFQVTFCRRPDTLYQQEWMHGHCELMSHMIWTPPYKHFNTDYPHPVSSFLRKLLLKSNTSIWTDIRKMQKRVSGIGTTCCRGRSQANSPPSSLHTVGSSKETPFIPNPICFNDLWY